MEEPGLFMRGFTDLRQLMREDTQIVRVFTPELLDPNSVWIYGSPPNMRDLTQIVRDFAPELLGKIRKSTEFGAK